MCIYVRAQGRARAHGCVSVIQVHTSLAYLLPRNLDGQFKLRVCHLRYLLLLLLLLLLLRASASDS